MTSLLVVFALLLCVACYQMDRRLAASRRLCTAHQSSLMLAYQDNARLQVLLDDSLDASDRIIALNNRLLGLSVKLVTESSTRSVILPPPGGMVA